MEGELEEVQVSLFFIYYLFSNMLHLTDTAGN